VNSWIGPVFAAVLFVLVGALFILFPAPGEEYSRRCLEKGFPEYKVAGPVLERQVYCVKRENQSDVVLRLE
jgi:hypothetical protein